MQTCSQCHYTRTPQDDDICPKGECPKCGVIYAKVLQRNQNIRETLDENKIKDLSNEKETQSVPPNLDIKPVPKVRPWVRYWARTLDIFLLNAIFYMGCIMIGERIEGVSIYLMGMILPVAWLFIEPIFLSSCGATPGKLLLRTKVYGQSGQFLTYSDALNRSMNVWVIGEALYIPIVLVITNLVAYNKLTKNGITTWDKAGNYTVTHNKIGAWCIIAFVLLFIVSFFIPAAALYESSPVPASSGRKPVMAFTTIQSAEGVTEADLDQAGLKNFETWLVEKMLQKGRNEYAEMGYNPKDFKPKVIANSVYVIVGGKKLAIIKVNMDNSMRWVTIMGIKGNELHRVSCIRNSNHDIPVWSGECGNKVNEVFGVSIQP